MTARRVAVVFEGEHRCLARVAGIEKDIIRLRRTFGFLYKLPEVKQAQAGHL
jgi:hypothetical protein